MYIYIYSYVKLICISLHIYIYIYIYVHDHTRTYFFSTIISLTPPNPEKSKTNECLKMHFPFYFLYKTMHVEEGHKGYSTPLGGLSPQNHLHVLPQLIKHHQPTWPHIACASVNKHRCQCGKNDGVPRKMIYRFNGVVTFFHFFPLLFFFTFLVVSCDSQL